MRRDLDLLEMCFEGNAVKQRPISHLPLNSFHSDDFLCLLFSNTNPLPVHLAKLKRWLLILADSKECKALRADAATQVGLWAQRHYMGNDQRFARLGASRPAMWFALARQLGDINGAYYHATSLMARENLEIEFDLKVSPLPSVVSTASRESLSTKAAAIDRELGLAWGAAARVVTRHVQHKFLGWREPEYAHGLACIVNYLALLPAASGLAARPSCVLGEINERLDALRWLKPAWGCLIRSHVESLGNDGGAIEEDLFQQQRIVIDFLRNSLEDALATQSEANDDLAWTTPCRSTRASKDSLIVITGQIPVSTDRSERDQLNLYEALRKPLAFRTLPALPELHKMRDRLEAEFPWASAAIARVMGELFARKRHGVSRLGITPTVLVGPPGTGKTRFAQRLGQALGTPDMMINLAGATDTKLLKGVTRGWASNRPSRIIEFIMHTKVPNPLVILDEIDKAHAGSTNGGDPQEALLDLLELANARRYQDIYLMTECDVSHCLYLCTSNSIERIAAPLLSRLQVVYFPPPGPEHADVIVHGILRDLEAQWNLPAGALEISRWQIEELRGLAPRQMRRAIMSLLAMQPTLTKNEHLH